jgi:quinol monooxygenase YgiN
MDTTRKAFNPHHGFFLIVITAMVTLFSFGNVSAQKKDQLIRLAKIKVDPAQLENYKLALKEGIETAVRVEPGVLTLYAMSDKNDPASITVLEIYADVDAYNAHIETPHFKKYKSTTMSMVKSL